MSESHFVLLFAFFLVLTYIFDLQCCVSFRYTAKWFSYTYMFFQILFPYWLLQNIKYSSLCYIVGLCWLSILSSSVYVLIPNS